MLDNKRYSFSAETETREGKPLKGTFTMRRTTLADMGAISAALSRLNEGQPFVSPAYEALLTSIITIAICGEDIPEWWKNISEDPVDTRAVMHVAGRMAVARDKRAPFPPKQIEQAETSG